MKTFSALLTTSLFLAFATGCSSTANREDMLSAAGFKVVRADTPEKEAHLRSLPPGKITPVQYNGATYYTFPDAKQNRLYVGRKAQYQEYRRLHPQKQTADEEVHAGQVNQEGARGIWEPWASPGWP